MAGIYYLYGMKYKPNNSGFAELLTGHRKVKKNFFWQINQLIDWQPIRSIIEDVSPKGKSNTGRLAYDGLILFKIELLRVWYGLSDGEVEEQVNDRLSFSRFAGIGMENEVPDSTTVCRFRNMLVRADAYERLLCEVNRQLEEKSIIVKSGAIVDASITNTPRRPRGKKKYEMVEDRHEDERDTTLVDSKLKECHQRGVDTEARWLEKMGKYHYGYKKHTVTDREGLVLAIETTPANESDIKHLETPLRKANLRERTPVQADKGYKSDKNDRILSSMRLRNRVMHKAARNRPLTPREEAFNKAISKTRYKIERTFGSIQCWFGGGVARYIGLSKTHGQHLMEAIAYNLYRSPGIAVSLSLR
jgi:IS5 family transposase